MKKEILDKITSASECGEPVSEQTALDILNSKQNDIPDILASSSRMKQKHFGNTVHLCSILNAKSGACPENCAFCAQSVHHNTNIETYPLKNGHEIANAFNDAESLPIDHFGVVTSGSCLKENELDNICKAIRKSKKSEIAWCASLGSLNTDQFKALKEAGLKRFHHNLETAESFFSEICTTHTYKKRLETIRNAKNAGLEICCGCIMGIGETKEQRVELALTLQRENVNSIPLNFIIPIPGTKLEKIEVMKPLDIIRCIAMFRMINPKVEIKVCAGRTHLRDLQSMIFHAGATGMMIGDLLTIAGREVKQDLQMLDDLEVDYAQRKMD
ncbi:biotin synthase BioB [Verrucomicrobiota bacterium]